MTQEFPPYSCAVEVTDEAGTIIARQEIRYGNLDGAMRAYGHAVEGHNTHERDERRNRAALRAARAEAETHAATAADAPAEA